MADEPDTPLADESAPDTPTDAAPLPPGHPTAETVEALEDKTLAELKSDAAAKGITITEGSGKSGAVVKDDLIAALEGIPEPPRGRPPLSEVARQLAAPFAPKED